jgi:hypothetical protein
VPALSAVIVWFGDRSLIAALLWLLGALAFGQLSLPVIFRIASRHTLFLEDDHFYLAAAIGWALVPGPIVGMLLGVLLPSIHDLGISACAGGLVGLVVGPVFTALEGIVVVAFFSLVCWLFTGKSLPNV